MPPQTINDETLNNSIANDDTLLYWDKSAGVQRKVERSSLIGGTIAGGGSVATGGFTLTVPATGTAALRDTTNTFTQNQFITKAAPELRLTNNATGSVSQLNLIDSDNGATLGNYVYIGRNTNATTPAAGLLLIRDKGNTGYRIWPDDDGNLRIGTTDPTSANDLTGTIVGTQTSHEAYKTITGEAQPISAVLARLQAAAPHVAQFIYTEHSAPETFEGLVIKQNAPETHHYGMDKHEAAYSAGKSLNLINLCADLLRAVVHLNERVVALEAQQGGN